MTIAVIIILVLLGVIAIFIYPKSTVNSGTYTHIHVKTGRKYEKIGEAVLESSLVELTIYKGDDGVTWARPSSEFNDRERFNVYN